MSFEVMEKPCDTCIYTKNTPSRRTVAELEAEVKDKRGWFKGHRVCHHSKKACCRGFWDRHKDKFDLGQIAQRLGFVKFVKGDRL